MKICFLGDAKSIHLIRWCEFFRDHGDEVTILTFRQNKIDGVNVIYVGDGINVNDDGGNYKYIKKVFMIKNIIKENKPDIVNAHYLTSYGLLGTLATKKVPLVISTWGSDILVTPKKNIIYKILTKYVLKKASLVTSDSKYMSNEIIKYGISYDKVVTSPMGIDTNIFNTKNLKKDSSKFKILSLRTLCKNSNIDIIISAFSLITKEYPNARLTIANDGIDKDEIKNLIDSNNLNDKIELLGSVSRDEVVKLLKENDVYVSIPTSDSTSVTLLEAMACGILPIVSDLPANKEWIKDKYNGLVIKIDERSLYETIKYIINNKSLMVDSSKANIDIVNKDAIWDDNMTKIRNSYLKILN